MKLPIIAYGDPVLRRRADEVPANFPDLKVLIDNMFETMYGAHGVGLAGPQVGLSLRLFVIDATPFADDDQQLNNFKKAFINPKILVETGDTWEFNEGCLSIPEIREDISRRKDLKITWMDENWQQHTSEFSGLAARIIQHEYDHIEGKLFTDKLPPLRKALLKNRLDAITKGLISVEYKMKFPAKKKGR